MIKAVNAASTFSGMILVSTTYIGKEARLAVAWTAKKKHTELRRMSESRPASDRTL